MGERELVDLSLRYGQWQPRWPGLTGLKTRCLPQEARVIIQTLKKTQTSWKRKIHLVKRRSRLFPCCVSAATIGLGGIQLFVDSGSLWIVTSLLGWSGTWLLSRLQRLLVILNLLQTPNEPQVDDREIPHSPEPSSSPVSTPFPTPVYTPAESESSAIPSPTVQTPDRTPTPSESSSTETEEQLKTPEKEVDETKEKSESEVREQKWSFMLPIVTADHGYECIPLHVLSYQGPVVRKPITLSSG